MVQVVITTEWYVINMPLQTKVTFLQKKNLNLTHSRPAGDERLPRVQRFRGDVLASARLPRPPAHPHPRLRHRRLQDQEELQRGQMGHLCHRLHHTR